MAQQPPERAGMPLHAVRSADNEDGIVHNLQGAFHFRGKIHMPRRIQERNYQILLKRNITSFKKLFPHGNPCLPGKNGNPAFPFLLVCIQVRIFMVNTSKRPDDSGLIKHRL